MLDELGLERGDIVILHTTYLAPLLSQRSDCPARYAVDVYDLIWRAHMLDVREGQRLTKIARLLYATAVRLRETRKLRHADLIVVAGWGDWLKITQDPRLRDVAVWAPTGLDARLAPKAEADRLHVGLIGNFKHSATVEAANALLKAPISRDERVKIVFAGLGSIDWARPLGVFAMGKVASVDEFYETIDFTVVPVVNGAGMKCKLAESALAGKVVVTTRAGASGFPPQLSKFFIIVDDVSALTVDAVRSDRAQSGSAMRAAFSDALSRDSARNHYRRVLLGVSDES